MQRTISTKEIKHVRTIMCLTSRESWIENVFLFLPLFYFAFWFCLCRCLYCCSCSCYFHCLFFPFKGSHNSLRNCNPFAIHRTAHISFPVKSRPSKCLFCSLLRGWGIEIVARKAVFDSPFFHGNDMIWTM